jgi:hypothetical protein
MLTESEFIDFLVQVRKMRRYGRAYASCDSAKLRQTYLDMYEHEAVPVDKVIVEYLGSVSNEYFPA